MYYNYFFILMAVTLVFILLFVNILNKKTAQNEEHNKVNKNKAWYTPLQNLKNIYHRNDQKEIVYLPYYSNEKIEKDIENLFLRVVMMLSEKNIEKISSSNMLGNNIKEYISNNMHKMTIIPIDKVISVNILSINGGIVTVIITSKLLTTHSSKEVQDHCEILKNGDDLILNKIYVKLFKKEFNHLDQLLKNQAEEKKEQI